MHWESVRLRPLDPDRDGPSLHAVFGDEASCRYMTRPATTSVAETVALLRGWTVGWAATSWAVVDDVDRALGRVSLYLADGPSGPWEAACMIVPRARGRGLARRALAQAIDVTLARTGPRRIRADIDPDNTPSKRTFEQLGFRFETRLTAAWTTPIGVRDSLIYVLDPEDPRPWHTPP